MQMKLQISTGQEAGRGGGAGVTTRLEEKQRSISSSPKPDAVW